MDYKVTNRQGFKFFFKNAISLPIIWLPLPFLIMFDLLFEFYHRTCFPLYGLEYVSRKKYIKVLDRGRLKYLHGFEKIGCMYCGYVNGWFLFAKEVAGRTEKYWCGIMHENKDYPQKTEHLKRDFSAFDDKDDFKNKYGD